MSDDAVEYIRKFLEQDHDRGVSPFIKAAVIGSDLSGKQGSAFIYGWRENGESRYSEVAVNAETMKDVFMTIAVFNVAQELYGDDSEFKAKVLEKTNEILAQAESKMAEHNGEQH